MKPIKPVVTALAMLLFASAVMQQQRRTIRWNAPSATCSW